MYIQVTLITKHGVSLCGRISFHVKSVCRISTIKNVSPHNFYNLPPCQQSVSVLCMARHQYYPSTKKVDAGNVRKVSVNQAFVASSARAIDGIYAIASAFSVVRSMTQSFFSAASSSFREIKF